MSKLKQQNQSLKDELARLATKKTNAGTEQARRAIAKANGKIGDSKSKKITQSKKEIKVVSKAKTAIKESRARKVSISLYLQDDDKINEIMQALPAGRYTTSEIIRIALVSFPKKNTDLHNVLSAVRSMDSRRK